MAAVRERTGHPAVGVVDPQVDERRAVVAHAVLEGVLDEDDEQQRGNRNLFGQILGVLHADFHVVGVADAHQFDVVFQELDVAVERDDLPPGVVQHVTHHLRKLDHGVLRGVGVDVDQRVDVVERVHEEVRVDLVLQVVHLGLQVLPLEGLHLLLVAHRLVDKLDAGVGSGHEETQHDVPVDFEVGERSLAVGVDRRGVALRRHVPQQALLVEVHQPEHGDDECDIEYEVLAVLVPQHVARRQQAVVDQEDDQIGGDLPPGDEHVLQIDVHFGHHLRVEHRNQDDGRPDHHVEQVFAYGLLSLDLHAGVRGAPVSCRAATRCKGTV